MTSPEFGAVADTHAPIWYLYADARLSSAARALIEAEVAAGRKTAVSSITLVEVIYLMEKGRLAPSCLDDLLALLDRPDAALAHVALDRGVAETMQRVSRSEVPDMPDRIIAATALHLGVPLISRDGRIRLSSVPTIW